VALSFYFFTGKIAAFWRSRRRLSLFFPCQVSFNNSETPKKRERIPPGSFSFFFYKKQDFFE